MSVLHSCIYIYIYMLEAVPQYSIYTPLYFGTGIFYHICVLEGDQ